MNYVRPEPNRPLTVVEIDDVIGEPGYLAALPHVRRVEPQGDGVLIVWIEDDDAPGPDLSEVCPDRAPEVQLHGPGAPRPGLLDHPRTEHVELFVDSVGHPEAAPFGWWHARIWLRACPDGGAPCSLPPFQ